MAQYIEITIPKVQKDRIEPRLEPVWLAYGFQGAVEEDLGERYCWKIYVTELENCLAQLQALSIPGLEVALQDIPDVDWTQNWRDFFQPIHLSPTLSIVAEGIPYTPAPQETVLRIIAGMAFGTGQHPTTQLIARALVQDFPERRWSHMLDVGCGSALLGLVGLTLGVGRADGVDIDPDALQVAEENIINNQMVDRYSLFIALDSLAGPYPLIVANILLDPLCEMAPDLIKRMASGGDLYLSGVLDEQRAPLESAYRELKLCQWETQGEWAMAHFRKP